MNTLRVLLTVRQLISIVTASVQESSTKIHKNVRADQNAKLVVLVTNLGTLSITFLSHFRYYLSKKLEIVVHLSQQRKLQR